MASADFFVERRWSVWLIDVSARERMYTAIVGRDRSLWVYAIALAACKTLASVKNAPRRKRLIYRSNCKGRTHHLLEAAYWGA